MAGAEEDYHGGRSERHVHEASSCRLSVRPLQLESPPSSALAEPHPSGCVSIWPVLTAAWIFPWTVAGIRLTIQTLRGSS